MRDTVLQWATVVGFGVVSFAANSGNVAVPNIFVAGTPAKAADVNSNFDAVSTAVNGSAADIAVLQTAVKAIPGGAVGATGAQGPVGATGPPGAQGQVGPPGPASSSVALIVKDSNGTLIGRLFPGSNVTPDTVVMNSPHGQPFILTISATQFIMNGGLYYLTSDCTGTPYIGVPLIGGSPVLPRAALVGTTAYIPVSVTSIVLTLSSSSATLPVTCILTNYPSPGPFFAVSETISVASYVPPFAAQ